MKPKILRKVTVNGHHVRVVKWGEGRFQAEVRMSHQFRFENYGPEAETEDHAYYWAFDSIFNFLQDTHQKRTA